MYVAVVDDDESLCRSFARLLRAAGFQQITYNSAESFLADTRRPQFGCLVLDIQLGAQDREHPSSSRVLGHPDV